MDDKYLQLAQNYDTFRITRVQRAINVNAWVCH